MDEQIWQRRKTWPSVPLSQVRKETKVIRFCKFCGMYEGATPPYNTKCWHVFEPPTELGEQTGMQAASPKYDPINCPAHYVTDTISAIEVIYAWKLDFMLGSVVKYINRYQRKDSPIEDLKKARKYLDMKIETLEKGELKDTIYHAVQGPGQAKTGK